MAREKMTNEQKELTALFRSWIESPTQGHILEKLAHGMVSYELKARLKKLPAEQHVPAAS